MLAQYSINNISQKVFPEWFGVSRDTHRFHSGPTDTALVHRCCRRGGWVTLTRSAPGDRLVALLLEIHRMLRFEHRCQIRIQSHGKCEPDLARQPLASDGRSENNVPGRRRPNRKRLQRQWKELRGFTGPGRALGYHKRRIGGCLIIISPLKVVTLHIHECFQG